MPYVRESELIKYYNMIRGSVFFSKSARNYLDFNEYEHTKHVHVFKVELMKSFC